MTPCVVLLCTLLLAAHVRVVRTLLIGSRRAHPTAPLAIPPPRFVQHRVAPYARTRLHLSDSKDGDGSSSGGSSSSSGDDGDWLTDAAADATGPRGRSLRRGSANSDLADKSIEELVAQAAREQKEAADAEKDAERAKKRDVLKRRADKEYEAYWDRQKSSTPQNEAAMLRAYYSLRKNETLSDKVGGLRMEGGDIGGEGADGGRPAAPAATQVRAQWPLPPWPLPRAAAVTLVKSPRSPVVVSWSDPFFPLSQDAPWDYASAPVTPRELATTGLSFAALFAAAAAAKRFGTVGKVTFTRPPPPPHPRHPLTHITAPLAPHCIVHQPPLAHPLDAVPVGGHGDHPASGPPRHPQKLLPGGALSGSHPPRPLACFLYNNGAPHRNT